MIGQVILDTRPPVALLNARAKHHDWAAGPSGLPHSKRASKISPRFISAQ